MTDYITGMTTAAAVFSAAAAAAGAYVAVKAFAFQQNVLFKKTTCEQILELSNQLHYLKALTYQSVLNAADEDIVGLKQRITTLRESVIVLESMVFRSAKEDVCKLRDVADGLLEYKIIENTTLRVQLANAIKALQRIYKAELK